MISLKKLLGKEEKFYDLLEASAEEAKSSTGLLAKILANESAAQASSIHDIIQTRRKDKRITQQITEELCRTFVTPLEREDIEALAFALYRIPKMVEKIVERLAIYPGPATSDRRVTFVKFPSPPCRLPVSGIRHDFLQKAAG